jgi:methyltransferase family protein
VDPDQSEFFRQFQQAWEGGYFESDPRDPLGASSYGVYGYNSVLYTVYSACIRPYVNRETTVLEIGPGRGAWTKTILARDCRKIYAVDAASPEHSQFWEYVGRDPRVEHIVANDFSLSGIPDGAIDFFFSFGTFSHLTAGMCEQYVSSLAPKMRRGARGFVMIGDFDKYNRCIDNAAHLSIGRILTDQRRKVWLPVRFAYLFVWKLFRSRMDLERVSKSREENLVAGPWPGWYHWGVGPACTALQRAGFDVIEADVEVISRDPMIHFVKR